MVASDVHPVNIENCGHFVPEECPEVILEQLDRLTDGLLNKVIRPSADGAGRIGKEND